MYATLDNPATGAELNRFYGDEITPYERNQAIIDQTRAFDADDLSNIAFENFDAIKAALESGDLLEVGRIMQVARKELIARTAAYGFGPSVVFSASMVLPA